MQREEHGIHRPLVLPVVPPVLIEREKKQASEEHICPVMWTYFYFTRRLVIRLPAPALPRGSSLDAKRGTRYSRGLTFILPAVASSFACLRRPFLVST